MNRGLKMNWRKQDEKIAASVINMECNRITQLEVVKEAFNDPQKKDLLERIFSCINSMFRRKWIIRLINNFKNLGRQVELEEMAKDAIQEGLTKFFTKTNINGLKNEASLETIVYSYVLMQFMKLRQERLRHPTGQIDETFLTIGDIASIEKHVWDEVFKEFLTERQYKLHLAIRMLDEKWQKILYWLYFDGLTKDEIAIKLKMKPGSVGNILTEARRLLKELLITKFDFFN